MNAMQPFLIRKAKRPSGVTTRHVGDERFGLLPGLRSSLLDTTIPRGFNPQVHIYIIHVI